MQRMGEGEYVIAGREVKVGFCRQAYLVVHDGPLRQPFTDYLENKESTAIYHQQGLKKSTLNNVPKDSRISFGDDANMYSRLDAMKVAKEQALFREKAAGYVSEGQMVPADLRQEYEKKIDVKLGKRRWSAKPTPQTPETAAPAWWPGTTNNPASMAPLSARPKSHVPAPMMPVASQVTVGQNLFGQVPDLFGQVGSNRMQVGDEVEIWSNSHNRWSPGIIDAVDGDQVSVKYASPGGAAMIKQMGRCHAHLRRPTGLSSTQTAPKQVLTAAPVPATMAMPMPVMPVYSPAGVKVQSMGLQQRTLVAGHLCGA